jgi:asparagine synthase (glutamine-hydrolysing)
MCGLVGYFSPTRTRTALGPLTEAASLIRHRGPDDEGYTAYDLASGQCRSWSGPESPPEIRDRLPLLGAGGEMPHNLALGFRRFSIVDLTPAGHQPFWNEDQSRCLTFNGEIYNYVELREELQAAGRVFRTRSDTEVLLAVLEAWGPEGLARLNGPFALALLDTARQRLLLARDRIGKSPLYWALTGETLFWASEIKSILLLAGRDTFDLNRQAAYDYLKHGWRDLDHGTFWEGVSSLAPACWVELDLRAGIDGQALTTGVRPYWQLPAQRLRPGEISFDESRRTFFDLFSDAVRLRLRADADVAFGLSGGLDSSSIVAVAASGAAPGSIATYTVKFDDPAVDEEPFARQVRDRWSDAVDYHVYRPQNTDFWDRADDFVWLQEEPFHSPNLELNQAYYRQMRADGFRVLIGGAAGDEVLAGYPEYFYPLLVHLLKQGRWLPLAGNVAGYTEQSLTRTAADTVAQLWRRMSGRSGGAYPGADLGRYCRENPDGYRAHDVGPPRSFNERMTGNMTQWKMNYWMRSGNKATMGVPIEPRAPFLDHRLVEFAFTLPPEYLVRRGWLKYILRRSAEPLLPREVAWRRKKVGFPFNDRAWLADARPVAEGHLRAAAGNPFIDPAPVIADYPRLIGERPEFLWRCISLCLWWRRVVCGERLSG